MYGPIQFNFHSVLDPQTHVNRFPIYPRLFQGNNGGQVGKPNDVQQYIKVKPLERKLILLVLEMLMILFLSLRFGSIQN